MTPDAEASDYCCVAVSCICMLSSVAVLHAVLADGQQNGNYVDGSSPW